MQLRKDASAVGGARRAEAPAPRVAGAASRSVRSQRPAGAAGAPAAALAGPAGRPMARPLRFAGTSRRAGARAVAAAAGDEGTVYDTVIVGAGISGLVTGLSLATNHSAAVPAFLVTEARERVGGNITSMSGGDGYVWEEGPNSFQPNDAMLQIAVRRRSPCHDRRRRHLARAATDP
jgi:oxygen-dependent protoporphyrinogen oxidase